MRLRSPSFAAATLAALVLLASSVLAQNAGGVQSITSVIASGNLVKVVPNAPVVVCGYPAVGYSTSTPCTNTVTTYSTPLPPLTACPAGMQVISPGTTTCSHTSDVSGNFAFFVSAPQIVTYVFQYLNNWYGPYVQSILSGGNGGGPGGTLGQLQANGSTGFSAIPGQLLATSFSGADICAQITAAVAALPSTGGTVLVPAGNFSACAGSGGIGIAISKNSVTIQGAGSCNQLISPTCAATTLNFAAGVTGIDNTGSNNTFRDFNLLSASTGAGTDDGIRNRGGTTTVERISISHFGRSGLLTLGNFPTGADTWNYSLLQSYLNYGDGFQWGTPCTDNHLGHGLLLTASVNGGWGFNILCGSDNEFHASLVQDNTAGGYSITGPDNYFFNAYAEGGTGSSLVLQSGTLGNQVWFNPFGQPATITDNSGTGANFVHYWTPDSQQAQNSPCIAPFPGATGATTYCERSGQFANSDLSIWDNTNSAYLVHYDPTTKWHFDQNVALPNGPAVATLASGTATMGTAAITSGTCAAAVTVSATNVVTTDVIIVTPNTDPTAVTGYGPSASGSLYIQAYPTANNVNFKVCNNTAGTITPSALTLNWRVPR